MALMVILLLFISISVYEGQSHHERLQSLVPEDLGPYPEFADTEETNDINVALPVKVGFSSFINFAFYASFRKVK